MAGAVFHFTPPLPPVAEKTSGLARTGAELAAGALRETPSSASARAVAGAWSGEGPAVSVVELLHTTYSTPLLCTRLTVAFDRYQIKLDKIYSNMNHMQRFGCFQCESTIPEMTSTDCHVF